MTVLASVPETENLEREKDPWWLLVDPFLILSALAIAAMGSVLVYSATRGVVDDFTEPDTSFLERQLLFIAVGVAVAAVAAFVAPRHMRRLYPLAFTAMMAALWLVLQVGVEVSGTRGWFSFGTFRMQPSEPGKLVVIAGLALLLSPRAGGAGLVRLGLALVLAAAPIGLLMLQPDLGTMLVYLVVALVTVVASGIKLRWIALLGIVAAVGIVGVLRSDALADYQEARLRVYLFAPSEANDDAATYAFNVEQAQIAIGNGGLQGQGLFEGTQTRSDLVPEQQTDFIFTVAGEELGLRGAALLLGLYAVLLFRIWRTAQIAATPFERLLCTGVFAMFLFQMFQSVGMTMGMMPVTGIPLPLVSYGGSSMLTSMAALGLVAGVYRRRLDIEGMLNQQM
ncbi:MAG: FtsW/RodA/SpoVE family cell cycle protein [Acidimicrobiaceae bacterium]|nr:FtsW/RodA/SpoVE family cell cycle protein [Acidimicrobiaceae bacterium]